MLGEALPSLLVYGLVFAAGVWFLLQVADAQDVRKKEPPAQAKGRDDGSHQGAGNRGTHYSLRSHNSERGAK